jgi:replicative DNA helicase
LYLVYCDDYNITDIENIAKKYVLQYKIEVFIFDYLQTSLRLMTEMRNKTSVRMQEYQILIVFVTRLKALAERLSICILTGTQL